MKKIVSVIIAIMALFAFTQLAAADNVQYIGGPYQYGSGGEFTMTPTGTILPGLVNSYASTTKGQVAGAINFQTFCLEYGEHISSGGTYYAVLNNAAVTGGTGTLSGDKISIGTAFLYYQFAKGILTGYDYTNPGRSNTGGSSADLLQRAIWFLEGESGGVDNAFVDFARTQLSLNTAGLEAANNGAYGVGVLNLWSDAAHVGNLAFANGEYTYARQDVLILTPEPMTMLLFGLGLIGLAGLRRKNS
jgi:hypothetical protein